MPSISIQPNRAYQNIPDVSDDPASQQMALQTIKDALQTHERRDGNYLKSFVRFEELVQLGIIDESGEFVLDLTTTGGGAAVLDDLLDVTVGPLVDNNILGYDTGTAMWTSQSAGSLNLSVVGHTHVIADIIDFPALALDDLADVDLSGAQDFDLLFRTGGDWVPTMGAMQWNGNDLHIDTGDINFYAVGGQVTQAIRQTANNLVLLSTFGDIVLDAAGDVEILDGAGLNLANNNAVGWYNISGVQVDMLTMAGTGSGPSSNWGTDPTIDWAFVGLVADTAALNSTGICSVSTSGMDTVHVSDDGLHVLVGTNGNDRIWSMTLDTPYDFANSTVDGALFNLVNPWYTIQWTNNGTNFIVQRASSNDVVQYPTDSPYVIDGLETALATVTNATFGFTGPGEVTYWMSRDGTLFYGYGEVSNVGTVRLFSLAVPYDISSWSLISSTSIEFVTNAPTADRPDWFGISPDGLTMGVIENNRLWLGNMSVANDPTTISFNGNELLISNFSNSAQGAFSADGNTFYVFGDNSVTPQVWSYTKNVQNPAQVPETFFVGNPNYATQLYGTKIGIENSIGVNWEDASGVDVEHLIFENVVAGGSPPTDPDIGSVTFLASFEDGTVGAEFYTPEIGPAINWSIVAGSQPGNVDAEISTVQVKYGTKSLYYKERAGGSNAGWASDAKQAGTVYGFTGDFTVETDIFLVDNTSAIEVMGLWDLGDRQWRWALEGGNSRMDFLVSTNGTSSFTPVAQHAWGGGGTGVPTGAWHHIAICRQGSNFYAWLDGVLSDNGVQVQAAVIHIPTDVYLVIGQQAFQDGAGQVEAYMDNIRITDGVARYTTAFTPPTGAFDGTSGIETFVVGDPAFVTQIDGSAINITADTDITGDLTLTGTVDGRDVALDGTVQDAHIADATIHFTEASIDHANILNIGTNTHAQIDTHIADATIHFTEASIDHANILNIGTNTHAAIDLHIADTDIHFSDAPADGTPYVREDNAWIAGSGGGASVSAPYRFDTSIVEADPGNGNFRMDNATPASVTEIFISSTTDDNNDADNILGLVAAGDQIYIQQDNDSSRFILLDVTANVDNTGWYSVAGTVANSGTIFSSNAKCHILILFGGSGGGGGLLPLSNSNLTGRITFEWRSDFNPRLNFGEDKSGSAAEIVYNGQLNLHSSITSNAVAGTLRIHSGMDTTASNLEVGHDSVNGFIRSDNTIGGTIDMRAQFGARDIRLIDGSGLMIEGKASAHADAIGFGQLWVDSGDELLKFTTESGVEYDLTAAGATDHTLLTNIGTNTHAQIDTHIADATIHFTQAAISIPASQVSDFDVEVANNSAVTLNTAKVTNATHTGQVTGATALVLDITAITDQAAAGALIGADTFLVNDGGLLREITATQMLTFFNAGGVTTFEGRSGAVVALAADYADVATIFTTDQTLSGTASLIMLDDREIRFGIGNDTTLDYESSSDYFVVNTGSLSNGIVFRDTAVDKIFFNMTSSRVELRDQFALRFYESSDATNVELDFDGTNFEINLPNEDSFVITEAGTQKFGVNHFSNRVDVFDGYELYVRSSDDAEWIVFDHDGFDAHIGAGGANPGSIIVDSAMVWNSDVDTIVANAATLTIELANAFEIDLAPATANVTLTLSGTPPTGRYYVCTVKVLQDATDRTITWAGGAFIWTDGAQHVQNTGSGAVSIYNFETWDAGTTWYASGVDYG